MGEGLLGEETCCNSKFGIGGSKYFGKRVAEQKKGLVIRGRRRDRAM